MDIAIFTGIKKARMFGKLVFFGMFKNKPPFRKKYILTQHSIGQLFKILKFKRGIGKDNIVSRFANSQKKEHIHFYGVNSLHIHFGGCFGNKLDKPAVGIHQVNFPATPGITLITDAACTPKKIKKTYLFKIEVICENIK